MKTPESKLLIGFAEKYYTLWTHWFEPIWERDSDSNMTYHQVGVTEHFSYERNVSMDINKVKKIHPNVEIDMALRGITQSWSTVKYDNGIFRGGKYRGRKIDDILKIDFDYCIWSASNYNYVSDYLETNAQYILYIMKQEAKRKKLEDGFGWLKVGDEVEIEFITNGYRGDFYDNNTNMWDRCFSNAKYGDIELKVEHNSGGKQVDGMYPYIMPVINGNQPHRIKNKTLKVKVLKIKLQEIYGDRGQQTIIIK